MTTNQTTLGDDVTVTDNPNDTTEPDRQTVPTTGSRAVSAVKRNPKKSATATTLVLAAAAAAVFLIRRRSAKAAARGRNPLASLLHR